MSQRVLFRRSATLLAAAMLTASPGCRRAERSAKSSANAVMVTRVTPPSVTMRVGELTELTVHGSGFAVENTVVLGPVTLTSVKATEQGTRIVLVIPDRVPSGGGAPPLLWSAGTYPLTVSNARGTSTPVTVTVLEPQ